MAATLSMSLSERERAFVMRQVMAGQYSQKVAAERLGIGVRQMKRLIRLWRAGGDASLVSRKRGQASNRTLSLRSMRPWKNTSAASIGVLVRPWRRKSWRNAMESRFRRRRCAVPRFAWACGGRRRDG